MTDLRRIEFPGTAYSPVETEEGSQLSTILHAVNSPVLFGCRSGLCGTCLVELEVLAGELAVPDAEEAEALEVYAPGNSRARLACQLQLTADLRLEVIPSS